MKRFFPLLAIGAALIMAAGCSVFMPDPEIRFQNASVDLVILYGIRVGEAEHVGSLSPGDVTKYYRTAAGSYSIELKHESGVWASATTGREGLTKGRKYTARMTGSTTAGFEFFLVED